MTLDLSVLDDSPPRGGLVGLSSGELAEDPFLSAGKSKRGKQFKGKLVIPDDAVWDSCQLVVPPFYQANVAAWEKLPLRFREDSSRRFLEDHSKALEPVRKVVSHGGTFTTQYAVEWGKRQGWKLIDRERYDHLTKRSHDLELGVDAIFDDGVSGRVGVQGAGRSERKVHFDRFMGRGGPSSASRRNIRIVYLEFVRGDKTPVVEEWWAGER
jgi:hypothetical protein